MKFFIETTVGNYNHTSILIKPLKNSSQKLSGEMSENPSKSFRRKRCQDLLFLCNIWIYSSRYRYVIIILINNVRGIVCGRFLRPLTTKKKMYLLHTLIIQYYQIDMYVHLRLKIKKKVIIIIFEFQWIIFFFQGIFYWGIEVKKCIVQADS